MKNSLRTAALVSTLAAALFSLPATAQPGPDAGGQGAGMAGGPGMGAGMPGKRGPLDCTKARNPERCQARQEEKQKARAICKGRMGTEYKQCMQQNMPPVDCGKSPNPERCAKRQQARAACKDKVGPEHRQCLRDNLAPKK